MREGRLIKIPSNNMLSKEKLYLAVLIFILSVTVKIIPSFFESLTADACIYMDIGRNFFSGRGFSLSYNIYQIWAGSPYYPALSLWPPLFPLAAGLVWKIFHSVQSVILLNVILAGINGALLFYILDIVYRNNKISFWAAFLFGISFPVQQTAMFAWSEQLSLLLLLSAMLVVLNDSGLTKPAMLKVGIILGAGFLVRFDAVFSLAAIALFILLNYKVSKKSCLACLYLLVGFLAIAIPYELFCILRYKLFYPFYLKTCSIGFSKAIFSGGYYDADKIPVLRTHILQRGFNLLLAMKTYPRAAGMFINEISSSFNFLIFFLILRACLLFKNNHSEERLLFILGLVSIITRIPSLSYPIDTGRFNLIPFACFIPLGLSQFYNTCTYLQKDFFRHYRKIYFFGIMILFFSFGKFMLIINGYFFRGTYDLVREENTQRDKLFSWLRSNTADKELVGIAGDLIQVVFSLDRPTALLPKAAVLNQKNIDDFLCIYKPSYVVISRNSLYLYKDFLTGYGRELGMLEKWQDYYCVYQIDRLRFCAQ